ncbi:MAG TPA: hypothetical protein PKV91_03920 [Bacillota bacterium]|jgi:hypothetical protein|nr:hypothetical protein [Bacillota bacterium]HOA35226.1 hypothetical protein [Bacillota bacterium]HOJ84815.1 hypothetical protein [Bacillota bacterium]HOL15664.1 hypothetical protein [Bacillota bacterium]HPZ11484.1 hypothetical protein [Bacillota bacterium]
MGKIKSARELAMERTANLEEMIEIAKAGPALEDEPYIKASSLLADSFVKKEAKLDKVIETFGRYPAGAREAAIRIFLEKIIAGMDFNSYEEAVAAYRHYRPGEKERLVKKIEEIGRGYREQVREMRSLAESGQCREQLLDHLYQEGISGTALAGVNLERSPWWKEQRDRLAAARASELAPLKKQLLSSLKQ